MLGNETNPLYFSIENKGEYIRLVISDNNGNYHIEYPTERLIKKGFKAEYEFPFTDEATNPIKVAIVPIELSSVEEARKALFKALAGCNDISADLFFTLLDKIDEAYLANKKGGAK